MKRLVISQYIGLLCNFKIGFGILFTIILIGGNSLKGHLMLLIFSI